MFNRKGAAGLVFALLLMLGPQAHADIIELSPGGEAYNGGDCQTDDPACGVGNSAILDWLDANVEGFDQDDSLYKSDAAEGVVAGDDSGSFANDFDTSFNEDRSGAIISQTEDGRTITDPSWLLVKDGNNSPVWYLFDISSWDGWMNIVLSDFWPNLGAISHVEIFGGGGTKVPEPGTLGLLGLGLVGLGFARRRRMMS